MVKRPSTCSSAAAARSSLPYVPQVVLLDLKLPKIDGLEVLRRIRESEQHRMLPVVVLTSSDEESDLMRSYKLGVNSYIRKPVNFTDFAEAPASWACIGWS